MTDIYDALCVVRTSIVNSVAEHLITGRPVVGNYATLLEDVADEINNQFNFISDLYNLSISDLEDLGFKFLNDESDLMLFPLWLYPFIPDDTMLHDIEGMHWVKGEDPVEIYADHWINAGIFTDSVVVVLDND